MIVDDGLALVCHRLRVQQACDDPSNGTKETNVTSNLLERSKHLNFVIGKSNSALELKEKHWVISRFNHSEELSLPSAEGKTIKQGIFEAQPVLLLDYDLITIHLDQVVTVYVFHIEVHGAQPGFIVCGVIDIPCIILNRLIQHNIFIYEFKRQFSVVQRELYHEYIWR